MDGIYKSTIYIYDFAFGLNELRWLDSANCPYTEVCSSRTLFDHVMENHDLIPDIVLMRASLRGQYC